MAEHERNLRVFLLEDDLIDAESVKRCLGKIGLPHLLTIFSNGSDMLQLLKAGEARILPSLFIVDLNLPGENGFEILKKIKADPALQTIPVIILTASDRKEDMISSYKQGAVFLKKSWDEKALREVIHQMKISGLLKF